MKVPPCPVCSDQRTRHVFTETAVRAMAYDKEGRRAPSHDQPPEVVSTDYEALLCARCSAFRHDLAVDDEQIVRA